MLCEAVYIGSFERCQEVDLTGTFTGAIELENMTTGRICEYDTADFGILATAAYTFESNGINYIFDVV
jgi:hypothetical protein